MSSFVPHNRCLGRSGRENSSIHSGGGSLYKVQRGSENSFLSSTSFQFQKNILVQKKDVFLKLNQHVFLITFLELFSNSFRILFENYSIRGFVPLVNH